MNVRYATEAGTPGRPNEDHYVVCGPDWIVVLDGATRHPEIADTGCVHDVRWLVRQFAGAIGSRMPLTSRPLDDLLADAIMDVMERHGGTCDLSHPDSPATTVSLCRVTGTTLEYLALADSPIAVLNPAGDVQVYTDDALAHLPGGQPYSRDLVRRHRNQPGGFWVASTAADAHTTPYGERPSWCPAVRWPCAPMEHQGSLRNTGTPGRRRSRCSGKAARLS